MIVLYVFFIRISGVENLLYDFQVDRNLFTSTMNASLFIGLSYLFYYSKAYINEREKNLIYQAKQKEIQIQQLRDRINPHFIFNVLNNMSALILKKDDKVQELVAKLSSVLRYAADDGDREKLPIPLEIENLKAYIDLILLQEPASTNIDIYVEGEIQNLEIVPFILISLLENAIKHGDIKTNPNGFIHIIISSDQQFSFEIENSKANTSEMKQGLGLQNIEEQLRLVYGEDYEFVINNNDDSYKAYLSINTQKMIKSEV